jgi:shikimate 5-dehydrogenase
MKKQAGMDMVLGVAMLTYQACMAASLWLVIQVSTHSLLGAWSF